MVKEIPYPVSTLAVETGKEKGHGRGRGQGQGHGQGQDRTGPETGQSRGQGKTAARHSLGTMKDMPQSVSTYADAISEPMMFPTDVWEFQMPKISPANTQLLVRTDTATSAAVRQRNCKRVIA